jgi:pSer/pThr/pTyr-binding forkhead associated (FHA) protein
MKSIQVITLDDGNKINMGRGHETDVRINDISVSRNHAQLMLLNNKIYIKDSKSKFGTLVLIQNSLAVTEKPIGLQIGRSFLECALMGRKEFDRIKKEQVVNLQNEKAVKGKQLFRNDILIVEVEKPGDKKEAAASTKIYRANLMDVDMLEYIDIDLFVNKTMKNNTLNSEKK